MRTCLSSCHNRLRSGSSWLAGAADLVGLGPLAYDTVDRAGLGLRVTPNFGLGTGVEHKDLAGLESRTPRLDNFERARGAGSAGVRVERRLAMPALGVRVAERMAGRLGPTSESSVSVSARSARRGKALRVVTGTSGPVTFDAEAD